MTSQNDVINPFLMPVLASDHERHNSGIVYWAKRNASGILIYTSMCGWGPDVAFCGVLTWRLSCVIFNVKFNV